jgi:transposase-like protein
MLNIDIQQLKHLYYTEKKSAFEIARILGCTPYPIYSRMKANGMKRRSYSEAQTNRYAHKTGDIKISEIVHLYFQEQLSLREVGARLGVSYDIIRKHLVAAGYERRKRGVVCRPRKSSSSHSKFTTADAAEMVRLYCEAGWSSVEIASRYNCCDVTVRGYLKRQGVQLRSVKEAQALRRKKETGLGTARSSHLSETDALPPEQVTPARILQLRSEENLTIDAIAVRCSLTNLQVYNILQEAGGL